MELLMATTDVVLQVVILTEDGKLHQKFCIQLIHNVKKLVQTTSPRADVVLSCDLHGHSRKPNVFMYGCNQR
jgi:hypothetical protein